MAKKALTVSIVIPVFNEQRHLKHCLETIAAQSVLPDEVIVVNNNCTDQSMAIAERFSFVRIITEKKQGIVAARDAGFNAASGTIIGRIDADTRLPKNWVAYLKEFYGQPGHSLTSITGPCYFYNVRLPQFDRWITSQFVYRMNAMMVGHYLLWGSNMAIPREVWGKVRPFVCRRSDIHEDLDLALHIHHAGFAIVFDSHLQASAFLARVFTNRQKLWPYLRMWPNTLRVHHIGKWRLSYFGSVFLYLMNFVPRLAEWLAVTSGRPPIKNRH